MGMFGNKKNLLPQATVADLMRDLPISVSNGPASTPGIGDDLPGSRQMGGMTTAPMVLGGGEASRQKFGTWEAIGTLGDALQAIGGGQGTYLPMVLGERQQQRQRQQAMQDFYAKQQVELQNAIRLAQEKSKNPDYDATERALIASGVTPGSPQWAAAMKTRAENALDPVVSGSIGGKDFFGPRSLVMSNLTGGGGDLPSVSSAADYERLPQGAQFRDPSGNIRTKGAR